MKLWLFLALFLAVGGFLFVGCQATRGGYESAPYKVIRKEGLFEIREYPAIAIVETPMADSGDGSFQRLFGFITGRNEAKQKIAMTTPVRIEGPVNRRTMAFVLPAQMPNGAIPQPADSKVSVRELPPGQFAVLRFRGGRNAEAEARALAKLTARMNAAGLPITGGAVFGYFDPPWTPVWFRRNEVMLPTQLSP